MKIELFDETTENPLELIGKRSGVCWNSPIDDYEKNVKRGKDCILAGHGRVMEYVNIEFVLSEFSARCVREIYTHIGGDPTRLQESTRYVDCNNFNFYIPNNIANDSKTLAIYNDAMKNIKDAYSLLLLNNISKEDAANILPLGMHTKVVMKCNLRMLENFFNMRLCSRALKEIRDFANMLKKELESKNSEWKWISEHLFVPKCEKTGYCTETKCCGRKPKKQ